MMNKLAFVSLAITIVTSSATASLTAASFKANPIEKVIEMMSDLQQKIIGEGKAAQKIYDEFAEWCEEESKSLQFTIKTAKAEAEDMNAVIDKAASDIKAFDEKIGELTSSISTDQSDLKAATTIREKEHGIFVTEEADLVDTVDTLERAIGIIEREMAKNPGASFVQLENAGSLAKTMKILVEAQGISNSDKSRLT